MLQIKPFMQKTGFSCGPASLKIVLEYYGIHKTEKQLVRLTNCTYYGTNAKNLLKTAEILGLKGIIIENFLRLWFDFPFPYIRSKNDLLLRTMIVLYK